MTTMVEETADRADEITRFDGSKRGVKGMVESGIARVPNIFIQPHHKRPQLCEPCNDPLVVVDLQGIQGPRRPEILRQIAGACQTWGFFQALNHSVPADLMATMMEASRAFHEEPAHHKAKYYSHDFGALIKYAPGFNLHRQQSVDWKDGLRVAYAPSRPHPAHWPPTLRQHGLGLEYCQHVTLLAETVLNLLSEALSLDPNYLLHTIDCMARQILMLNFYPPCPQPHLTLGSSIHSDSGSLTILMEDQVGGLQVKNNGNWHAVSPIPGAFVMIIGDQLEILSNGIFKSVQHRAVTNSVKARVSIPMFFSPAMGSSVKIAPIAALLNASNPPLYGSIDFDDYMTRYLNTADHSKSCLDLVRLTSSSSDSFAQSVLQ